MTATYRRVEGEELDRVLAQLETAKRTQAAKNVVQEYWGERASEVRYLRITFSSSYNDEGGNDPYYTIVGLRDVDPATVPIDPDEEDDGEYEDNEARESALVAKYDDPIVLPVKNMWERHVVNEELGLKYYGGDALFDGGEEERELITIDLRAEALVPVLYVREEVAA